MDQWFGAAARVSRYRVHEFVQAMSGQCGRASFDAKVFDVAPDSGLIVFGHDPILSSLDPNGRRLSPTGTRYSRCDPSAQMLAELADTHDTEMIIIGISRSGMQSHDLPLMGPAVASSPLGRGAL